MPNHPANRLRALRLERGWTQEQLAEKVERLAWSRRETVGLTGDKVSKWERGTVGVSLRYRGLLAAVFGDSEHQLGLPSTARGARPATPASDETLIATIDHAADLLTQLGNPGQTLRPALLAAVTEDVLSRRSILAALDTEPTPRGPIGPDELDDLAGRYDTAHATAPPAALLTGLRTHLRIVSDALTQQPTTGTRQRLLRNRARVAILAGRIAAEDTGEVMAARGYYAQAIDDAREIGDHQVAVIAYGYAAQLATDQGQHVAALDHLDAAAKLNPGDPAVTAWLAATEAAVQAAAGNQPAAREALDQAHASAEQVTGPPAVRWFTGQAALRAHLTATAGRVLLAADDHDAARDRLTEAAAQCTALGAAGRHDLLACRLDLADTEYAASRYTAAVRAAADVARLLDLTRHVAATSRLRRLCDLLHTALSTADATAADLVGARRALTTLYADVA